MCTIIRKRICADYLFLIFLVGNRLQIEENKSNRNSGVASLAVIGVGVDMIFVPRLRSLITRQAKRISSSSKVIGIQKMKGAQLQAAQQLARRVMHDKELDTWSSYNIDANEEVNDKQIQQLAKV
jgi:hypothetical protein